MYKDAKNYFDSSPDAERPEPNDDYCKRVENRPAYSLEKAIDFDKMLKKQSRQSKTEFDPWEG